MTHSPAGTTPNGTVGPSRTTDILRIQHPATRVKSGGVVYEPSGS